jgi:hypothetical protein
MSVDPNSIPFGDDRQLPEPLTEEELRLAKEYERLRAKRASEVARTSERPVRPSPPTGRSDVGRSVAPLFQSDRARRVDPNDRGEGRSTLERPTVAERPFALPVGDFIALEREHREPLLASQDGRAVVGAHSLTFLGALGGHGKTTWAVDVFLHLSAVVASTDDASTAPGRGVPDGASQRERAPRL